MAIKSFSQKFFKDVNDFLKVRNTFKKVVFTNGCFDILHLGHIRYLESARKLGTTLVIGLNSDASTKRLQKSGPPRPINTCEVRAEILTALSFVDFVIPFEDDTALNLVKSIRPEIYCKGGDWKFEDIPEAKFVKSYGGDFHSIQFENNFSTTSILEKLMNEK